MQTISQSFRESARLLSACTRLQKKHSLAEQYLVEIIFIETRWCCPFWWELYGRLMGKYYWISLPLWTNKQAYEATLNRIQLLLHQGQPHQLRLTVVLQTLIFHITNFLILFWMEIPGPSECQAHALPLNYPPPYSLVTPLMPFLFASPWLKWNCISYRPECRVHDLTIFYSLMFPFGLVKVIALNDGVGTLRILLCLDP